MKFRDRVLWFVAIVCCLSFASSAYAQTLDAGEVEATVQAGIVAGIGTHASFAGSAGKAITDRIFAFGEFGYIPIGSGTVTSPGGNFSIGNSGRVLSFMGGAQYQFNENNSFTPYAGAALGAVRTSFKSTIVGAPISETDISASATKFYGSFGGGARYYVNESWGFKPELMIFAGSDSFVRFSVGVFYQFRR